MECFGFMPVGVDVRYRSILRAHLKGVRFRSKTKKILQDVCECQGWPKSAYFPKLQACAVRLNLTIVARRKQAVDSVQSVVVKIALKVCCWVYAMHNWRFGLLIQIPDHFWKEIGAVGEFSPSLYRNCLLLGTSPHRFADGTALNCDDWKILKNWSGLNLLLAITL